MPVVSDNVRNTSLAMRYNSNDQIVVRAKCGATVTAYVPQMIYWDNEGYITKALVLSTGTATNPAMFYVGICEQSGTTGNHYDYVIAGPTKCKTTGVFIAGVPAYLSTGAAVISATTSLVAVGLMSEIGIWQEALPTTVVSTADFNIMLNGTLKYMTS